MWCQCVQGDREADHTITTQAAVTSDSVSGELAKRCMKRPPLEGVDGLGGQHWVCFRPCSTLYVTK